MSRFISNVNFLIISVFLLFCIILCIPISCGLPVDITRGVVITASNTKVLYAQSTLQMLKQLGTELKPDCIGVNIHYRQDNLTSSVVYKYDSTPTTSSLNQFAQLASLYGMKIMIKIIIVTKADNPNDWMNIKPDDPDKWFDSYFNLLSELTTIDNVECIAIGTENQSLSLNFPEYFIKLIAKLRTIYKGKLTYAALITEFKNIKFWDKLDFIGIDAYLPGTVTNNINPTKEQMVQLLSMYYSHLLEWRLANYPNIPIYFTETGVASYTGVAAQPWIVPEETCQGFISNTTAQTLMYEAMFDSMTKVEVLKGLFLFRVDLESNSDFIGPPQGKTFTCGYTIRNKPVWNVIVKEFSRN